MTARLLVTGGCGYIGSHMVERILAAGHECIVIDDGSTGYGDALVGGELVEGDCSDPELLDHVFRSWRFDGVLHFASKIEVGESQRDPGKYYYCNTAKTLALARAMVAHGVGLLIFSSTAAVYGDPHYTPIDEDHPQRPINPYGASKQMAERMLADFDRVHGLRSVSLRYFNAAGADPQARIGERHDPETHLIPLALHAVLGVRGPLQVFGRDYATENGTCVRDFIHVNDLAEAHLRALEYLWAGGPSDAFNLGTGMGFSVQQVLDTVARVCGKSVPVVEATRREGDPERLVADAARARDRLGWSPRRSDLDTIVRDAWRWENKRCGERLDVETG